VEHLCDSLQKAQVEQKCAQSGVCPRTLGSVLTKSHRALRTARRDLALLLPCGGGIAVALKSLLEDSWSLMQALATGLSVLSHIYSGIVSSMPAHMAMAILNCPLRSSTWGSSPLHRAAVAGDREGVVALLAEEPERVNESNEYGSTALHVLFAAWGTAGASGARDTAWAPCAAALLEARADVWAVDGLHRSVLACAPTLEARRLLVDSRHRRGILRAPIPPEEGYEAATYAYHIKMAPRSCFKSLLEDSRLATIVSPLLSRDSAAGVSDIACWPLAVVDTSRIPVGAPLKSVRLFLIELLDALCTGPYNMLWLAQVLPSFMLS